MDVEPVPCVIANSRVSFLSLHCLSSITTMKGLVDVSNPSNSNDVATKCETKSYRKQRATSKGAWTPEEDQILEETIAIHGPKRWKKIAASAGLKRCGKSCRLRWMNYLRPNIKRGNISDQEEDLILRLHKLLGNRWSLIAGRLPGRTDNEIKNYWNTHLSKRVMKKAANKTEACSNVYNEQHQSTSSSIIVEADHQHTKLHNNNSSNFVSNEQFGFLSEGFFDVDWVSSFLEMNGFE